MPLPSPPEALRGVVLRQELHQQLLQLLGLKGQSGDPAGCRIKK